MKKICSVICALMLFFCLTGIANATSFYEEYSGYQNVWQGNSFSFDFDFWYTKDVDGATTDSALELTQDTFGALDNNWESMTLSIDFYSVDWEPDWADISLSTFSNGATIDLGTNIVSSSAWSGSTFSYSYTFTPVQVALFEALGWTTVTIAANEYGNFYDYFIANDFAITKVAMELKTTAAPVPEPATVLLMGAGLIGLVAFGRKRFNGKKKV